MGVVEKTKAWQMLGKALNTKAGTRAAGAAAAVVNSVMAQAAPAVDTDLSWTAFEKPLHHTRVALVSTAGFYVEGQKPFDVNAKAGDASFRVIAGDVDLAQLHVAHTHYSHRYVDKDINVLFPIERLGELERQGTFRLSPRHYSFGFGGMLTSAYTDPSSGTAHQLAKELQKDEVDVALLVPA